MRKTWLLAAAAGTLALLCGCSRNEPARVEAAEESLQKVTAVRAAKTDLSKAMEITAEFRPWQEVDVHAKVAGYLKQITVDVGDRVRAGQTLGVLEVPEYHEELQQATAAQKRSELDVVRARSEVKRAESAREIARITYDRLMSVSKARPHLIAQQEIDNAQAKYQEAEAALSTAQANAAAIEQQVAVSAAGKARVSTMMSYLRVTAPFSGLVTKRYADTGAMIQAGTASQTQAMPLVRISQVDRLRLALPVPESIVSRIRIGSPVEVRVDSLQRVFQGRVSRFSGRLEATTRTMETEVDIPNPGGELMPGMYGYASLVLDKRQEALAVPVQAVHGIGSKPTVLVFSDTNRKLETRPVTVGLETPDLVEITSGLNGGELVVIGNRNQIAMDRKTVVRIVQASELAGVH